MDDPYQSPMALRHPFLTDESDTALGYGVSV